MAFRTLLYLNDASARCLLKNVSCKKIILQVPNSLKCHRGFKRLRDMTNNDAFVNTSSLSLKNIWKPLGFTILFGSATHLGAAVWEYEKIRSHTYKMMNRYHQWRATRTGWRGELESWWRSLSDGQRIFIPICYLNIMVFLGWRIPALSGTMTKYFCANPASRAICWPMVLSTFSHHSLVHLAVNMYVLHSFSTAAVATLGREQFVALYLTSGVLSSFASHLYKIAFQRPGLSLGASGAIMGIVSFICAQYPDTRLSIAFLPMITFTAGNAIKGLLAMDSIGCIMGWRFFDHAAHLGGALWGIYWQMWGNSHIWQKREPVLSLWHNFRDPPRSH
ncbi:presenilins-associated rhomboid-like protein, mitochondrial [Microplitis demolitor]|uniref:presenilins-associated rhomboid-like protein, mitochondrial n=1 Tax=Microplitis demolitor TaxID=69319 RepID=UPI0004CD39E0|nr:presenilins-associated rhomboid-like protein, mitochondrial [Microplitis demolitor]